MDLAQATQATEELTIAGRVFPVRQLRLREWGELQSWLKTRFPSPIALAIKGIEDARKQGVSISKETETALFAQAQSEARSWPPRVASSAWISAVESAEGGREKFIQAALFHGGTVVSDDEAAQLLDEIGVGDLGRLMVACLSGESSVPKAGTDSTNPSR
jgi:hypothetical protein